MREAVKKTLQANSHRAETMRRMNALILTKQVSYPIQEIFKNFLEKTKSICSLDASLTREAIAIREAFNEAVDTLLASYQAGTLEEKDIKCFYESYRMPDFEFQIGIEREIASAANAGQNPNSWLLTHYFTDGLISSVIPIEFIQNISNAELSLYSHKSPVTGRPTDFPCGLWSYTALFRSRLPLSLIERLTQIYIKNNLSQRLPSKLVGMNVTYEEIEDSKASDAGKVYRCRLTFPVRPQIEAPIQKKKDTLPFETVKQTFSEDNQDAELQNRILHISKALLDRYMDEQDESIKSVIERDLISLVHTMEMRPLNILQDISVSLENKSESEYGDYTKFSNYAIEDISYAVVSELSLQQLQTLASFHGFFGWTVKSCECLVQPTEQDERGFYKLTLTNAKLGAARLLLDL